MIRFDTTTEEAATIKKIAKRYRDLQKKHGFKPRPQLDVEMDLSATHLNGNPLRLADLLAADDSNLGHDVGGIADHLDREKGKLVRCFRPRYSVPASR